MKWFGKKTETKENKVVTVEDAIRFLEEYNKELMKKNQESLNKAK